MFQLPRHMLASQYSLASFKRHLDRGPVRCIFWGHLKTRRMWVSKEVQERTRNFLNFAGFGKLFYQKNKNYRSLCFGDLGENDFIIFSHPKTHPFQQTSLSPRRGRAPGAFENDVFCFGMFFDQEKYPHPSEALRFESLALMWKFEHQGFN